MLWTLASKFVFTFIVIFSSGFEDTLFDGAGDDGWGFWAETVLTIIITESFSILYDDIGSSGFNIFPLKINFWFDGGIDEYSSIFFITSSTFESELTVTTLISEVYVVLILIFISVIFNYNLLIFSNLNY